MTKHTSIAINIVRRLGLARSTLEWWALYIRMLSRYPFAKHQLKRLPRDHISDKLVQALDFFEIQTRIKATTKIPKSANNVDITMFDIHNGRQAALYSQDMDEPRH